VKVRWRLVAPQATYACPPWDNAIREHLGCDDSAPGYKKYLRSFWDAAQKEWPLTGQSRLLSRA